MICFAFNNTSCYCFYCNETIRKCDVLLLTIPVVSVSIAMKLLDCNVKMWRFAFNNTSCRGFYGNETITECDVFSFNNTSCHCFSCNETITKCECLTMLLTIQNVMFCLSQYLLLCLYCNETITKCDVFAFNNTPCHCFYCNEIIGKCDILLLAIHLVTVSIETMFCF